MPIGHVRMNSRVRDTLNPEAGNHAQGDRMRGHRQGVLHRVLPDTVAKLPDRVLG
jgi:hypothetical protein